MPLSSIFYPVVRFEDQDWYSLKRAALESGKLFVDPKFPPTNESLYTKDELAPYTDIVWKRPKVTSYTQALSSDINKLLYLDVELRIVL